jgi:hypothetical protein
MAYRLRSLFDVSLDHESRTKPPILHSQSNNLAPNVMLRRRAEQGEDTMMRLIGLVVPTLSHLAAARSVAAISPAKLRPRSGASRRGLTITGFAPRILALTRGRPFALTGAVLAGCVMMLAACSNKTAPGSETTLEGQLPSGSVEMHEVQAAYIASGSGGSGVVHYQGVSYPFTVGGVGVGGIGASTIEGRGDVYNLTNLSQFPGTYGEGRYGFALGQTSAGDLWMKNENGVVIHLKAERTGLMLSLGGSAVVISMNQ